MLAAGSAAIGKLAANSGVDIGDVDVASCALPTGAATAAKQLADGHNVVVTTCAIPTGAATSAKQDTGNSSVASIDGKITACNTGAVVLAAGAAAIGKLAANSGVDIGDVDVASCALPTGAATSAKQDTGNTSLGTIDTNTGAIKTAVEALDNSVDGNYLNVNLNVAGTDVAGNSGNKSAQTLRVVIATDQPQLTAKLLVTPDAVAIPAGTAVIGEVIPSSYPTTDNAKFMRKYYTSAGAATDGIVWSPAAATRWYVTDLIISVSAATTVTFEDDKAGGDDPVLKLDLAANGGAVINFRTPMASGEDAADLLVTTSAGNIYITAVGYEV